MTDQSRQKSKFIHSAGLLVLSMVILFCGWLVFHSRLPRPAPATVQEDGLSQVRQIVAVIAGSTWGGSQRGQLLVQTLNQLIDAKRVIFTDQIQDAGLTLRGPRGLKCIYLKVLLGEQGQYLLHDSALLCDVLFHESLHVMSVGQNSIEQESDAFLAGLDARCAFEQKKRPKRFMVEGGSIGSFVLKRYPELKRDSQYKPLVVQLDWVIEQSELQ